MVDGKLQSRKWQDRDGNNRTSVEIVADSCYFGDSKRDGDGGGNSYGGGYGGYEPPYAGGGVSASGFSEIEEDGELPF